MRITLNKYLIISFIPLIIWAFTLSYDFGLSFLLFFTIYLIFKRGFKKNKIGYLAYFILMLSFLLAYFFRAYLLIPYPQFYLYGYAANLKEIINSSLWEIVLFFGMISTGYLLGFKLLKKNKSNKTKALLRENWMVHLFPILIRLFYLLVLIKLGVIFATGAGIKGEESSSVFAFLLRLVPDDLIFVVTMVYLLKYRGKLTQKRRFWLYGLIALMSFSILITGSKIFIILLGLCFFIGVLYEGFRFRILRLILMTFIGVILIVGSFSFSKAIRVNISSNPIELLEYTINDMSSSQNIILADMVTSRFVGLDGMVAVKRINENKKRLLKDIFSIKNTLLKTLEYIIPGIKLTDQVTSGKGVAIYIANLNYKMVHAGAIGVFAAFYLMWPNFVWASSLIFGIILGLVFKKISRIKDEDIKLIIFYFFSYFLIHTFMSGNFNGLIGGLVIKIILLLIYIQYAKVFKRLTPLYSQK